MSISHGIIGYYRVCIKSNTTDATSGAGTAYHSEAHEFTPRFFVGFVVVNL